MVKNKYTQQDKNQYLCIAQEYNRLKANLTDANKTRFIGVAILLHAQRGRVPKAWRTQAFIDLIGFLEN